MRLVAAVLGLALLANGCASIDPTDPSHFTDVFVRNDIGANVVIVQCDTSCDVLHERTAIAGGETSTINVSNEGITVGYAVEQPSGRKLGCLYMRFNNVRTTPTVDVSTLQHCR